MKEKQRIITVIIVVLVYNLIDQFLFRSQRGITISSVIISMVIAFVLYLVLIYFFGKKHMN
jgi:predicted permease